jgi:hypothetical protein
MVVILVKQIPNADIFVEAVRQVFGFFYSLSPFEKVVGACGEAEGTCIKYLLTLLFQVTPG